MSDAEVDLGYREIEDLPLTVRFPLEEENPFAKAHQFLVWTTTPWTLPANTALGCRPKRKVCSSGKIVENKKKELPIDFPRELSKEIPKEKLICAEAASCRGFRRRARKNIRSCVSF